jgi:hypothetical protein
MNVVAMLRNHLSLPTLPLSPPLHATISPASPLALCTMATPSLPQGWEQRASDNGTPYYINHTDKTTHWSLPAPPPYSPPQPTDSSSEDTTKPTALPQTSPDESDHEPEAEAEAESAAESEPKPEAEAESEAEPEHKHKSTLSKIGKYLSPDYYLKDPNTKSIKSSYNAPKNTCVIC